MPAPQVGAELFWAVDAIPTPAVHLVDPGLFGRGEMAHPAAVPVAGAVRRGA